LQKITKLAPNREPALFVENAKDTPQYLPLVPILGVKLTNEGRIVKYEDGSQYLIEKSIKSKGVYIGDICAICGMGEVVDAGGCATCSRCNAQLKCGL